MLACIGRVEVVLRSSELSTYDLVLNYHPYIKTEAWGGCGFKSQHWKLDGHFCTLIYCMSDDDQK